MSETDDTDDLLLIPPDFFVQDFEFDLQQPYLSVFDSIITQVNKLENRLDHMESSASDLSLLNNTTVTDPHIYNRKDRYTGMESTQSTPQKPRTKFKLNSLPSSPNADRYSPTKLRTNLFAPRNIANHYQDMTESNNNLVNVDSHTSSSKVKSSVLSEIDEFISNVKTIERINKGKECDAARKRLDIEDINRLINKLEKDEDKEKVNAQENELIDNTIESATGVKYVMYKDRDSKTTSEIKLTSPNLKKAQPSQKTVTTTDSYITEEVQSVTSSEDTQTTTLHYVKSAPEISQLPSDNFTHENKVTLTYKRDVRQNIPHNSAGDGKSSVPSIDSLKILSLRDLWSEKQGGEFNSSERTRFLQKLEEEKLRRQHCEKLIQNLQTRILELQEKLAVALDVDEAKDDAIVKFHEAWENVDLRLKKANKENADLRIEMETLKAKNQRELQDAYMKIAHYEEEVSKALNIAHNAQQKLLALEKQCTDFDNEKHNLEMQLQTLQCKLDGELEKSKQLTEVVAQKEIEMNENKNVLASARKEVMQSKKAVEVCQQEFASLKAECTSLQAQLAEKQKKNGELEGFKRKLLADIEAHRKNEKDLKEELQKFKESMEHHKTDLRNFYQNQVETVVRDKLREFQTQLDRAESLLQEEVKNKELSIARTAAMHIQSISEKHALEVQLLEEKHKEEVRLYHVQLSQNEQQIQNLQTKFHQQQEKKSQLAQQLHKVMEAQWLEALKIINNSKSPVPSNTKGFSTIDQLSSLKSKSYLDFEELLNSTEAKNGNTESTNKEGAVENVESTSSLVEDERALKDDRQHRSQKNRKQSEQELQKYMQMLLTKSAEDIKQQALDKESADNAADQRTVWQLQDDNKSSRSSSRDRRLGKPPWK